MSESDFVGSTQSPEALRAQLALIERKIAFEEERRRDVEHRLDMQRRGLAGVDHADAVRQREADIAKLRAEKEQLVEWLQRGVSEAQRIAEQIQDLRASNEAVRSAERDLAEDKERLDGIARKLEIELESARARLRSARDELAVVDEQAQRQQRREAAEAAVGGTLSARIAAARRDIDTALVDVRNVERIEHAMDCLAAKVRRARHVLEVLNLGVSEGTMLSLPDPDDDGYDSEEGADTTRVPAVLLASTKGTISRCDALLRTLVSAMKRSEADLAARVESRGRRHQEMLAEMRRETARTKDECAASLEAMRRDTEEREPQLRRYLQLRNEHVARQESRSPGRASSAPSPEHFSLIDHIAQENRELHEEHDALAKRRSHLAEKLRTREDDYRALREMKHLYRDLESQKTVLSYNIRAAEQENRQLKSWLWERGAPQELVKTPRKQQPWRSP